MRTLNIVTLTPQFTDALKKEMNRTNTRPRDLAVKLGISATSVYAWFNGSSKGIKKNHLKVICETFPRIAELMTDDFVDMRDTNQELVNISTAYLKRNLIVNLFSNYNFSEEDKRNMAVIIKNRPNINFDNDVQGFREFYADILFELSIKGFVREEVTDFIVERYNIELKGYLEYLGVFAEICNQE